MRVLVTGATGFVGGNLVPALLEAGHDVVALTRDADRYDGPAAVEVREGDLLEPGALPSLSDIDAAYYLVHSMGYGEDFAERDRRAARNFREAADDGGVERVVYLGGLGEERSADLSEHLASRREVESVLAEGAYDLTVLRAAIIIGAGSASFEMVRQLAKRLPVMVTPTWVSNRCQPIAITDVVGYLVGVLDAPATAGGTYEIGGPDVLTYGEILRKTARELRGWEPIIVPVPFLSPKLSTYWVDLVTDVSKGVAHPLILGLANEVVVTDDAIRDHVAVEDVPFQVAVRRALGDAAHDSGRSDDGDVAQPGAAEGETAAREEADP